jgi:hypothetical protein
VIAHTAVFSGKSWVAIMADMGVFCMIDRIAQLLEARQKACNSSQGRVLQLYHTRRILRKAVEGPAKGGDLSTNGCLPLFVQ